MEKNKIQRKKERMVRPRASLRIDKSYNRFRWVLRRTFPNRGHSKYVFGNDSLEDMITASRIVAARKDGISIKLERETTKAKTIADRVGFERGRHGSYRDISSHELNRAILQKNKTVNKPTAHTLDIYKQFKRDE